MKTIPKAFEKVWHDGLIYNLNKLGTSGGLQRHRGEGLTTFLVHTFVTECHSRKHWNILLLILYDNSSKEFYWVYLFIFQARVDFLWKFWIQYHIFSSEVKKAGLILRVILSDFLSWCKYFLTVLHLVSILCKDLSKICYCKVC